MPLNRYFRQGTKSEQDLRESLFAEAIGIYGVETYYLPRKIINLDTILNEVIESKFGDAFKIEMYMRNIDTYDGDGETLSKFGLEIRNQLTLQVSRRRWKQLVGRFKVNQDVTPAEGDLLYLPMINGLFEIKFADDDLEAFYQLRDNPWYQINCELFQYSNEKIDTGIPEIDKVEAQESYKIFLTLGNGSGTYELYEPVTQIISNSLTISGEVVTVDGNKIGVTQTVASNGSGSLWAVTAGSIGNLIGSKSNASYTINSMSTIDLDDQDLQAQNKAFEDSGNEIIDFTETNPFGEANYIQ